MPKQNRLILGLMSGTSVDGVDAALVRIHGRAPHYRATILAHLAVPWPKALRARLLAIMAPAQTTTQEICELNVLVANHLAHVVHLTLKTHHLPPTAITAIASHGQTVCHLPLTKSKIENRKSKIFPTASTLQLGDPSVIATLTNITTIGNFRPADMALGGQGAPLVPWPDAVLLTHPQKIRCVQNIGGIANVTYLPKAQKPSADKTLGAFPNVLAFDTGPGNMLLDAVITLATKGRQTYDKNGRLAARGVVDPKLFSQLRQHPYFTRRPPKSTGREDFGFTLAKQLYHTQIENRKSKIENLISTLTRLTAWSIVDAYLSFLPELPDEVILCGGGADNPTLVAMLQDELTTAAQGLDRPPIKLLRIDDIDNGAIPNKAKEAASFALLGAATLDGIPSNVPSVTDAKRAAILGVVAIGNVNTRGKSSE